MSDMCCPACNAKLTLKQAIQILNGSGFKRIAKCKTPRGEIVYLPAGQVNPKEVEVLTE